MAVCVVERGEAVEIEYDEGKPDSVPISVELDLHRVQEAFAAQQVSQRIVQEARVQQVLQSTRRGDVTSGDDVPLEFDIGDRTDDCLDVDRSRISSQSQVVRAHARGVMCQLCQRQLDLVIAGTIDYVGEFVPVESVEWLRCVVQRHVTFDARTGVDEKPVAVEHEDVFT